MNELREAIETFLSLSKEESQMGPRMEALRLREEKVRDELRQVKCRIAELAGAADHPDGACFLLDGKVLIVSPNSFAGGPFVKLCDTVKLP